MKKIDFKSVSVWSWIKGIIITVLFLLCVIWIGNYWLLLATPLVFDIYITRIIPWDFWKRRKNGKKPSAVVD